MSLVVWIVIYWATVAWLVTAVLCTLISRAKRLTAMRQMQGASHHRQPVQR